MRDDAISRKAAIDAINHICPVDTEYDCALLDRVDVRRVLSDLPSAQTERKAGRWFVLDECANEGICCSECHKKVLKIDYSNTMKWKNFKFCPNCGADMRGEQNETN